MPATPITLTDPGRTGLEALVRRHTTPQQIATRARIVLAAAAGQTNVQIVQQIGVSRESVRLWRDRWAALRDIPLADLSVAERLADAPRPGTPGGSRRRRSVRSWRSPVPRLPRRDDRSASGAVARSPTRSSHAALWRRSHRATRPACSKGGPQTAPDALLAHAEQRRGVCDQGDGVVHSLP